MFNEKFIKIVNRAAKHGLYCLRITTEQDYDCVQFFDPDVKIPWSPESFHYEIRRFKDGSYRIGFHCEKSNQNYIFADNRMMPFLKQCFDMALAAQIAKSFTTSDTKLWGDEIKFNTQKTENIEIYWDIELNEQDSDDVITWKLSEFRKSLNPVIGAAIGGFIQAAQPYIGQ